MYCILIKSMYFVLSTVDIVLLHQFTVTPQWQSAKYFFDQSDSVECVLDYIDVSSAVQGMDMGSKLDFCTIFKNKHSDRTLNVL